MGQQLEFGPPRQAWMRAVSHGFEDCVRQGDAPIDADRAREQQMGYLDLLESLGVEVEVLDADGFPDSCFIEDTAVVLGQRAVVTRPACAPRQGETELVRSAFEEASLEFVEMADGGGTLEGGDVMRAGSVLFVGRTERTSPDGISWLADVASHDGLEIVPVEVRSGLHLKSAVTLLDPTRVVCHGDGVDLGPLKAAGLECVAVPEAAGANVLALGTQVVVSTAAPRTAEVISSLGFEVHTVKVSELHKADGALTCLSLRFAGPGQWCA